MKIEYDVGKSRQNAKRRGLPFADAMDLWGGPHVRRHDVRRDYGELRIIADALIRGRMHVCVYTLGGHAYRIISRRKANRREVDGYGPYVLR